MSGADKRVYLYDSTLRDGAQTVGVDFSAADKAAIAVELDRLGIDYVEGGWPGANPTDDAFFRNPPKPPSSGTRRSSATSGSPPSA
jgi:2-isopropylmalate synthase